MSDLKLLTELCHHVVVEISGIIRDNGLWETEPARKIIFDESCDDLLCKPCLGFRFDPLCKVINSH